MRIYLLCGKARHGKDTTALLLKEELEKRSKRVLILQYSYYIKEFAKKISDWDGSDETKPRTLLQELGTDIIRNKIDNLFFIKRLMDDLKVYEFYFDEIIISDVRFKEEIVNPKKVYKDVLAINIIRPNFDNQLDAKQSMHVTENGLNNFTEYDYVINNEKDIEHLKNEVRKLVDKYES